MVEMMWQRRTAGAATATPEARAALQATLRADVVQIGDAGLRAQYDREMRDRLWALFRPARSVSGRAAAAGKGSPWTAAGTTPLAPTRNSFLAAVADADVVREAVILAALVAHPALLADHLSDLERTDFTGPGHADIAAALLRHAPLDDAARGHAVALDLDQGVLDGLAARPHVRLARGARPGDPPDDARACLTEAFARLHAVRAQRAEVSEAELDIGAAADEVLTRRLARAAQRSAAAERGSAEDSVETVRAENGMDLPRQEKEAMDRLTAQLLGRALPPPRRPG
jgi:DNA primase